MILGDILARGVCKNYETFGIGEKPWLAEVASFFTEIGERHGSIAANVILDAVKDTLHIHFPIFLVAFFAFGFLKCF